MKRTITILEDDIDGSEASQTVFFALDGIEYEIDLNDAHANELREAFERFTDAGRKITSRRGRKPTPWARQPTHGDPDAKALRLWAAENGIKVSARGRIQAEVIEQYATAH